jgi:hypothetical protein
MTAVLKLPPKPHSEMKIGKKVQRKRLRRQRKNRAA